MRSTFRGSPVFIYSLSLYLSLSTVDFNCLVVGDTFLPPVSEGWGKVMFSLVSVCLSTSLLGRLRSGWYAFCGLAGGLSCLYTIF